MKEPPPAVRALLGFAFGLSFMIACVWVFHVNDFDYNNMARGVQLIWQGMNPWRPEAYTPDFYNPPFAALFLWPMIFLTPRVVLAIGGALLFAYAFYRRAWVALAWFFTYSFLSLVAAGGIDMLVMGGGLLLLAAGDAHFHQKRGLLLRVLAYGLLLVKPQGTIFIVAIYILAKRDWKGALAGLAVYGLPFLGLFPDWLGAILNNPPSYQTAVAHTLLKKFGWATAALIAGLALSARRWRYWQIGAALAQILSPYGMPAAPVFVILTAIPNLTAAPLIVLFSACLSAMTLVNPPPTVTDFYAYMNPLLSIYHITMLGLALGLACISRPEDPPVDTDVDAPKRLRPGFSRIAENTQRLLKISGK